MKKRHLKKLQLILISLAVDSVIVFAAVDYFISDDFAEVNNIIIKENIIAIGVDCKGIAAGISPERAMYIQQGIDKVLDVRPNIYDVFKRTIDHYNITLEDVKIVSYADDIYYSETVFKLNNRIFKVDSRPSDAIALALRTDSDIYINKTLIELYGQQIC